MGRTGSGPKVLGVGVWLRVAAATAVGEGLEVGVTIGGRLTIDFGVSIGGRLRSGSGDRDGENPGFGA